MTDPPTCGVLAACGRWAHHRGHHGGFRVVDGIPSDLADLAEPITAREVEVLLELMEGRGAKAVAGRLGISERTTKNHLTAVYRKLDVTSLVGAYRRLGWLAVRRDAVRLEVAKAELLGQVQQTLTNLEGIQDALADDDVEAVS